MIMQIAPSRLSGRICAPPSKSLAHRAVICAGLSEGTSVISNLSLSEDIEASIDAMRQLGAQIGLEMDSGGGYTATVSGGRAPQDIRIDCGESGSTLRFLLPLTLAVSNGALFEGRGRLGQRPMDVYRDLLVSQGITWEAQSGGLPLTVAGRLFPGQYMIPGNVSSQFVTGLLIALPLLGGGSALKVTGTLESRPYVDLTLDILKKHGIKFRQAEPGLFSVPGMQRYKPCGYRIEGDWSQAAFLIAFGALGDGVEITGLDPASAQGDRRILEIYSRMGGDYTWRGAELVINHLELFGTRIDLSDCPDLAPPVAALCAAAGGRSVLSGIGRLRLKESDRIESIMACIRAVGGTVGMEDECMVITGGGLTGGAVDASGDHRIAMMAAALSPACESQVVVKGAEAVGKSWPRFWDDFRSLGGKANEQLG